MILLRLAKHAIELITALVVIYIGALICFPPLQWYVSQVRVEPNSTYTPRVYPSLYAYRSSYAYIRPSRMR